MQVVYWFMFYSTVSVSGDLASLSTYYKPSRITYSLTCFITTPILKYPFQFGGTIVTLSCCGNIFRRYSLSKNLLLEYYSGMKEFFSIEILLFGRWLMVVPFIENGNSVPDTHVGGLFRACQSSPTAAAHLSLYA